MGNRNFVTGNFKAVTKNRLPQTSPGLEFQIPLRFGACSCLSLRNRMRI